MMGTPDMQLLILSAALFMIAARPQTGQAVPWESGEGSINVKRSDISVDIKVRQTDVNGERRIFVDFELKNAGSTERRLERWLALDPPVVTLALLRIERSDGSRIAFIGRRMSRRIPQRADYVHLRSGESRVVKDVD